MLNTLEHRIISYRPESTQTPCAQSARDSPDRNIKQSCATTSGSTAMRRRRRRPS